VLSLGWDTKVLKGKTAALVQAVAKANANTIVVVQSVGAVDLESFADNANGATILCATILFLSPCVVTAIVWSGLGGQEVSIRMG
jgi:hypothetical protein